MNKVNEISKLSLHNALAMTTTDNTSVNANEQFDNEIRLFMNDAKACQRSRGHSLASRRFMQDRTHYCNQTFIFCT
jgi:hypothetical protein